MCGNGKVPADQFGKPALNMVLRDMNRQSDVYRTAMRAFAERNYDLINRHRFRQNPIMNSSRRTIQHSLRIVDGVSDLPTWRR